MNPIVSQKTREQIWGSMFHWHCFFLPLRISNLPLRRKICLPTLLVSPISFRCFGSFTWRLAWGWYARGCRHTMIKRYRATARRFGKPSRRLTVTFVSRGEPTWGELIPLFWSFWVHRAWYRRESMGPIIFSSPLPWMRRKCKRSSTSTFTLYWTLWRPSTSYRLTRRESWGDSRRKRPGLVGNTRRIFPCWRPNLCFGLLKSV